MVHAEGFNDFIKKEDNYITIERIRKFDSADMVVRYTISILLRGILILTTNYRAPEILEFGKYYKKYIQADFMKIPK